MSIADEINRIATAVMESFEEVEAKGVIVPTGSHVDDLPGFIQSIQKGITPTGTKSITANGTHDVTNYASANVNVPGIDTTETTNPITAAAVVNGKIGFVNGQKVTGSFASQTKSVTPTTSSQNVTPDSGKWLSQVSVDAIQTQTKTATPSTSAQDITPDSGKYLSKVTVNAVQTQTKAATPSTSTQNVTPDSGKFLTQVTVNPIPSGYIVPSGTKTINANGTGIDVAEYAKATVNVKDSEHYAYGYKTMTANADFLVTGIVDQQGNTFTPKGYMFMLAPNISSNTNYTNSTNCLECCLYDTVNNRMYRDIWFHPEYTTRVAPSVSSGSVGSGRFEQSASSNSLYNVIGQRYFWIAWG